MTAFPLTVPPDILDAESTSDTLASEGMRVLMNCRATGNPQPAISWKRQDERPMRICKAKNKGVRRGHDCKDGIKEWPISDFYHPLTVAVHHGPELELPSVGRGDAGVYYCIASNGVPPTVSKRVRLYVECKNLCTF